jgi:hypothetical protein
MWASGAYSHVTNSDVPAISLVPTDTTNSGALLLSGLAGDPNVTWPAVAYNWAVPIQNKRMLHFGCWCVGSWFNFQSNMQRENAYGHLFCGSYS